MFKKLIKRNKTKISHNDDLDLHNLPEHVAIIMDGNGRWAKKRKMPSIQREVERSHTR